MFIGRTVAEAKVPICGLPDVKAGSLEKIIMLGKTEAKGKVGDRR